MKMKGKVAAWFWIIMGIGEGAFFYLMAGMSGQIVPLTIGFIYFNLMIIPLITNNYVELEEDQLTVVCGFVKESIEFQDIVKVYGTHNPVATSATSLDRIVIKGKDKKLICAVEDKEKLFQMLQRRNTDIAFCTK